MRLHITFHEDTRFTVGFQEGTQFTADFGEVQYISGADWYEGEYEVFPRFAEQTLETEEKMMRHDVTVHEIPVTRTTNPHGGQTVVIG